MESRSATHVFDLESRPEKRASVLKLIEQNFPKGFALSRPLSIEEEFFALLSPQNGTRVLFICDENDEALSALGWKLFEARESTTNTVLPMAGIGLVVTAKEKRGKGLSTALLLEAEARAVQEGALLSCLWSGMEFYLKRDYLPLGSELSWVLDKPEQDLLHRRLKTEGASSKIALEAGTDADVETALEFFEASKIGPTREPSLLRSFRRLPDSEFLVARDAGRHFQGYALIGKAQDLRHTLHEVIGDKSLVPLCLERLLSQTAKDEKAMIRVQYPADGVLGDELRYWLGAKAPEAFTLIKLLDPRGFADFLMRNHILPGLKIEVLQDGFRILDAVGREEFFSADHSHLIQLFMSPFHPREFGTLSPKLIHHLDSFHPLNPYLWGLDSV